MRRVRLWLVAGSLIIFLLAYGSINTDVGSDPRLTLLVSQALIDHRTAYLDAYAQDTLLGVPFDDYVAEGTILRTGEHYSYYFPVGPSVVALPFVAVARLNDWDMRTPDNYRLQEILAALAATVAFLLSYALARCYVSEQASLAIAFVSVLGSSLISTLGTAFWSHNPTVLFIGVALLLLARAGSGADGAPHPLALGIFLFLAFLCRASATAFILPVFGYLALRQRRTLLPTAGVALILLLLYLFWMYRLTGSGTTAYYSPARLAVERAPLWVGVAGNLVSPGRGILIFSPFLLVLATGYVAHWNNLRHQPMVWLCLVWFGLHFVLVARAASWWGGWSFGPRLLTDLWPGIVVLTALGWATVTSATADHRARPWRMAYFGLAVPAILINTFIGLYSQPASRWNEMVQPLAMGEKDHSDFFDWRYPQMLATNAMLCAMERKRFDQTTAPDYLATYSIGQIIPSNADQLVASWLVASASSSSSSTPVGAIPESFPFGFYLPFVSTPGNLARFLGWDDPEIENDGTSARWSLCEYAEIRFYLAGSSAPGDLLLAVRGQSLGRQNIRYRINATLIGQHNWSGEMSEVQIIRFPGELMHENTFNVLTFEFPDARAASLRDQRSLGLALESVLLSRGVGGIAPLPAATPPPYPAP